MKKTALLFFFLSVCSVFCMAQTQDEADVIRSSWAQKPIVGVKDGNILTLLRAFNKVWPTTPATEILAHPVSTGNEADSYSIVVDRPNGYVSAQELGDDGEDIAACVWKRSNGHKLFAVAYTRYHGLFPHPIMLFYDYNAATQTLTPELDALAQFLPAFNDASVDAVHFQLPQHGKDVVVTEYLMGWYFSIKHTYKWNGMGPEWYSTTIEHMDEMCQLYDNYYQLENKVKFDKFALHDFDEDDNPELWLSSDNGDSQAIYSIVAGKIQMVASTYFKTHFLFHSNTIGSAGGCGTGCFAAQYVTLEHSLPQRKFEDNQSYNYQTDEMESTYVMDGKEISTQEGEKFLKSLGEPEDLTPLFGRIK